jgi:hypothetical protein
VTLSEFKGSLSGSTPPQLGAPVLEALWWAARADWDRAHALVQNETGRSAAWVHAYLHRVEGDLGNARYWYRQAERPVASASLENEWEAIAAALLAEAAR